MPPEGSDAAGTKVQYHSRGGTPTVVAGETRMHGDGPGSGPSDHRLDPDEGGES